MADLGSAFVQVLPDTSALNAQMGAYFTSSRWKGMGKAAGVALGAGLAAGGVVKGLYEIGQAFDDAYDKIRVSTGKSGRDLGKLKRSFKDVVSDVPTDFDTASTAVADLSRRLDLSGKPLERLSKQMLELSRITETDVGQNIQSVTRLFGDWSIKTGKQSQTLDKLFRVSQATGIQVSDLSDLMVQFGSPLRQLGIDFDTAAAMFSRFEREGVNIQTLMPGLRFALKTLSGATPEVTAELEKLGIATGDPAKGLQQVFEQIEDAGSAAKANQLAFKVFGVRAGPDMAAAIREGRFELDELMQVMGKGSDTIRDAARDTMDFGEQWTLLKNNVFVALEPVAKRVFGAIGDEARRVRKILTDKDLSADEKFTAVFEHIGNRIGELLPKVAKAGLEIGGKLAKGILRGVVNLDAETKLNLIALLGGVAAIRLAANSAGKLIGKHMGKGVVIGVALALPALADDIYNFGKKHSVEIRNAGIAAGEWFVNGIIDAVNLGIRGINEAMDEANIWSFLGVDAPNIPEIGDIKFDRVREEAKKTEDSLRDLIDGLDKVGGKTRDAGKVWDGYFRGLKDNLDRGNRETGRHDERVDRSLDGVRKQFNKTSGTISGFTRDSGRDLDRSGDNTGKFKDRSDRDLDAVDKSFDKTTSSSGKMAKGVGRNVQSLVNGVGEGLGVLKDNLNKSLAAFKVKSVSYSIKKAGNVVGDVVGAQHGAIVPGTGSGDKVPLHINGQLAAMVEPNELVSVTNRTATAALMRVNRDIPRRQDGGIVPHLAKGGGLMAPFDVQGSKPGFVPFMNFLNNMYGPLYVMSGYRPGSITTSGNVSNHASGHAVDISTHESGVDQATGPGSLGGPGAARMDDLHSYMARNIKLPGDFLWRTYTGGNHYNHIHRGITSAEADDPRKMIAYLSGLPGGGAIAESLKRLILKGPKGPLREMGQGALDKAWKAANDFLSRQGPGYSAGKYLKGKGDIFTASWYGPTPATVGAAGVSLPGTMSFAELSDPPGSLNFSALGGLPYHAKIGVRYKGKAIEVEKLDVGAGGPGLGGHVRAIDLWEDAAKQLPGFMSAGIANVEVLRKHGGLVPRLAKGGIVELLGATIGAIRHMNDKRTTKAVERWGEAVKGYGVPAKLVERMVALRHDADKFGEYASNAATLSDDGIFGRFLGATEAEWTQKQLSALFKLRNRLIAAKKLLDRQIRQQVKVLKEAESRLRQTNRAIGEGEDEREDLEERLEKAKKAKNKDLEEHLQARLDSLDERQEVREAIAAKLKSPIISSLKKLGGRLKGGSKEFSSRSLVEEALTSVQGIDGPMRKLTKLPAIGALGGEIFEAQVTLRNLDAEAHPTDTGLDIAGLRDVIEAARYGVFDRYAGTFGSGGRLGPGQWGIAGETGRPEIVHGPATVLSPQATQGALAGNIEVHNDFDFDGMDLIVTTTVNGELAKQQRLEHRRSRQAVR